MTTLTPLIERYVDYRRTAGEFTPYTAESVTYLLGQLDATHGHRTLATFGTATIDRWWLSIAHLAPGTRALYAAHVRQFCRWLLVREAITKDPTRLLVTVHQPDRAIVTFTKAEMAQLRAHVAGIDLRAQAMIELMYGGGARCCEVSRLNVQDYDSRARDVILTGKRGKQRVTPLDAEACRILDRYLDEAGRRGGPFIRSTVRTNARLGDKTVSIYVRRYIAGAGLKRGPWDGRSPHALRRTAVSEVIEKAQDLRVGQEFAGHASMRTTEEHYARRVASPRVREAVERRDRAS